MKKSLLLAAALGLASASSLMADVNVYLTGSTAFRAQVYAACKNLFNTKSNFTIVYGDGAHGGNSPSTTDSGNTSWCMTGIATNTLNFSNNVLVVHALFTGSIQGIQSVENAQPLTFLVGNGANGTVLTANTNYTTSAPTIAFSDSASATTPAYDVANFPGFAEEAMAVQPFVFCKSLAPSGAVTTITNITWEQFRSMYPKGRLPYSAWTGKLTDTNTYIYLNNRTTDSGSRVTALSEILYPYSQSSTVYLYSHSALAFYLATNSLFATAGTPGFGVIGGSAGNGNANLAWGSGYIGGGDLRTGLKIADVQNQAIGYLSFADAKSGGASGNWQSTIAYNGTWPTAAGAGLTGTTTNDFSPVCLGSYPFWTYEVVVYPTTDPIPGINQSDLGDQNTPGTFLGVLDNVSTTIATLPGSLDNEIQNSKSVSPGATAIRIFDMTAARGTVGGTISVTPY
jgi:hypothetical protein